MGISRKICMNEVWTEIWHGLTSLPAFRYLLAGLVLALGVFLATFFISL